MTYSWRRCGNDGLHLPDPAIVVTPISLKKIFHRLLSGRGRSKICRVNRGKSNWSLGWRNGRAGLGSGGSLGRGSLRGSVLGEGGRKPRKTCNCQNRKTC